MKRFLLLLSFLFIAQIDAAAKGEQIDYYDDSEFSREVEYSQNKYKAHGGDQAILGWAEGLPEQWSPPGENSFYKPKQAKFFHPEGQYDDENINAIAQKVRSNLAGKDSQQLLRLFGSNMSGVAYTLQVMNNLAGLDGPLNPKYEQHRGRYNSKDLHRALLDSMVEQQIIRELLSQYSFTLPNRSAREKMEKYHQMLDEYWGESAYPYVLDGVRYRIKAVRTLQNKQRKAEVEAIVAEAKAAKQRELEQLVQDAANRDDMRLLEEIKRLSRELGNFDQYAVPTRGRLYPPTPPASSSGTP